MTHSTVQATGSEMERDRIAAEAVVRHHAQLGMGLLERTRRLLELAAEGAASEAQAARGELLRFVDAELVPHAKAEEQTIYVTAARYPECELVVQGMLGEHVAILQLVDELRDAPSAVLAAASARALLAVFETHLAKENDLIVPAIVENAEDSLADLLDGMHSLLGGEAVADEGGCGCGGCGCGGDAAGSGEATAPVLSVDPRIDVRDIPHEHRHATVLGAIAQLPPGGAVVLVAPHAPRPLLAQIDDHFGGAVNVEWLQEGPEVWQLRLERSRN